MAAETSQQPIPVQRHIYDHIALVMIVAGLSAGLTYVEVAGLPKIPQVDQLFSQPKAAAPSPAKPAPASTTAKNSVQPAAPTAAPPAPAAPAKPTATTVSFVHMRAGKTTASPILFDLDAGTTVELTDDSNPQWQGVVYQGQAGYIFKTYLQYSQ